MTDAVKASRRYESPLRAQQVRSTRRAILGAAADLFGAEGYAATTIAAIAQRAGVSVQTVYAAFGTKGGVLAGLRDVRLAGDDEPVAVERRDAWRRMIDDPDPESRVARLAGLAALINARAADTYQLIRHSVGADPEMAGLLERDAAERHADMAAVAATFTRQPRRRTAIQDALYALVSPDLYALLVIDRDWSPKQYERWLTGQLRAATSS